MDINTEFRLSSNFDNWLNEFNDGKVNVIRLCDHDTKADFINGKPINDHYRNVFTLSRRWQALNVRQEHADEGIVTFEKIYSQDLVRPEDVPNRLAMGFPEAKISFVPKYKAYLVDQRSGPNL